jgi:hypothetical protein
MRSAVLNSHVFQTSAQRDPVATVALRTQSATVDSTAVSGLVRCCVVSGLVRCRDWTLLQLTEWGPL